MSRAAFEVLLTVSLSDKNVLEAFVESMLIFTFALLIADPKGADEELHLVFLSGEHMLDGGPDL